MLYGEKDDKDAYNEKFQYLKSLEEGGKIFPERMTDPSLTKKQRDNKKYKVILIYFKNIYIFKYNIII